MIDILLISSLANAQYKINKSKYNYRIYSYEVGDPYSPVAAGITSLLIPGLGQALSGEPKRGLVFFGGFTACTIITSIGLLRLVELIGSGISGEVPKGSGLGMMAAGSVGMYTVDIWSIIDAVRVAKVNNLAFRDKNKTSYIFQIHPFINTAYYNQYASIPIGLTLKVRF